MALVSMAVFDPPNEPRTKLLVDCLMSLGRTVDWSRHRLAIVSNGICEESREFIIQGIETYETWGFTDGDENRGTAKAVNMGWMQREPGEHALKLDSDAVLHESGWLDKLEECIERDPRIGQVALKRPDLAQSPDFPLGDWRRSTLKMLPHKRGETWLTVEKCDDIIGTCVLHSSALLDKVGYLYQYGGVYAADDADMSVRSICAGFYNCFLCNVPISHPDPGGDQFTKWKQDYAGPQVAKFREAREMYKRGTMPLYHGPDDK